MALNKTDLEKIGIIFDAKVQPFMLQLQRHEQTLFGATGDNGLNSEVKKLSDQMNDTRLFKGKYLFGVSVLVVVLTLLSNFLADLIK